MTCVMSWGRCSLIGLLVVMSVVVVLVLLLFVRRLPASSCSSGRATVSQKTVSNTTVYADARRNTHTVTTEH